MFPRVMCLVGKLKRLLRSSRLENWGSLADLGIALSLSSLRHQRVFVAFEGKDAAWGGIILPS